MTTRTYDEAWAASPIPTRIAAEMYLNYLNAIPLALMFGPEVFDLVTQAGLFNVVLEAKGFKQRGATDGE